MTDRTRPTDTPSSPTSASGEKPGNRKLIRPSIEAHVGRAPARSGAPRRKTVAPERTGVEAAFHARHAAAGSVLVVTLEDGMVLRGVLEWHDQRCIKIRPEEGPGIVIMKHAIVHAGAIARLGPRSHPR